MSIPYLPDHHNYYEVSEKNHENYFTKNFDECMKRLELIEKEHEMIENEDKRNRFYSLKKPTKRQMTPTDNAIFPPEETTETNETRNEENSEAEMKKTNKEAKEKTEVRDRSRSLSHIYTEKETEVKRNFINGGTIILVNGGNEKPSCTGSTNVIILGSAETKLTGMS